MSLRAFSRFVGVGLGIAAGAYGACAGITWYRYGGPAPPRGDERDELLDRFLPRYDVVERHHVRVAAPAAVTLAVARELDVSESAVVRAIFRGRELLLGATPEPRVRPRGLLADVQAMGWVVLAETPGREVVVGAVTKPWEANVVFRSIPPERFAAFAEPEYVKIVWTLRADPVGPHESIFRTETRAAATDEGARRRFRRYWALLSPGIAIIRRMMLGPLKQEAERQALTVA